MSLALVWSKIVPAIVIGLTNPGKGIPVTGLPKPFQDIILFLSGSPRRSGISEGHLSLASAWFKICSAIVIGLTNPDKGIPVTGLPKSFQGIPVFLSESPGRSGISEDHPPLASVLFKIGPAFVIGLTTPDKGIPVTGLPKLSQGIPVFLSRSPVFVRTICY